MGEKFEVRLMELMFERATPRISDTGEIWDLNEVILEPWEAIECVRQMLNEFQAVIYQP